MDAKTFILEINLDILFSDPHDHTKREESILILSKIEQKRCFIR
jgi:hypothetical protein